MVKIDKIYTRAGDKGKTRLSTGEPLDKWHPRVAAYGTVDEVNAALGVAALHADGDMLAALRRVQNDLFDLGADLATPDRGTKLEWTPLRIVEAQVKRLEAEIDAMNVNIAPLDSFILPGGSALAAHMHVARTLCRRAERQIAELFAMEGEVVSPEALAYANRLSDWLFVTGRVANNDGKDDIKWVPGANR
ncbi:cob(I)yrinic acid a,c-diamide adenosyltransferase [Hyphomonas sp.]|uniref:cob(I)yrinic acid a,c-diamide adenosyltransferase n=1 Tax=Hyphomonas sp. TaxID=87 RepID=UPI003D26E13B